MRSSSDHPFFRRANELSERQLTTGFKLLQHMIHLKKQKMPGRSCKMDEAVETAKEFFRYLGESNISTVLPVTVLTGIVFNQLNCSRELLKFNAADRLKKKYKFNSCTLSNLINFFISLNVDAKNFKKCYNLPEFWSTESRSWSTCFWRIKEMHGK